MLESGVMAIFEGKMVDLKVDDIVETVLECPVCEHLLRGIVTYDKQQGTFAIDFVNDGFSSPIANFIESGMVYIGHDRENLGTDNPLLKVPKE